MLVLSIAAVFIESSPWLLLLFFMPRGMYIHAERLLAKAGGSKCKERGIAHPWSEAERTKRKRRAAQAKTGTRRVFFTRWGGEARKPGETPCARERGRAPIGRLVYSIRASAHMNFGEGSCGEGTAPQRWWRRTGGIVRRQEESSSYKKKKRRICERMRS